MTNSTISNLTAGISTERMVMGNSDSTKKTEEAQAFFSTLMNQAGNNLTQNQTAAKSQNAAEINSTQSKTQTNDYSASKIKPAEKKETIVKDSLNEKAEALGNEIKDTIKDQLDVTDDQVEETMENLGFTVLDLLIPSNLADLVGELTGSEDAVSLLTNDAFLDVMQEMADVNRNLADTLGVSVEEMQKLVEEMNFEMTSFEVESDGLLDRQLGDLNVSDITVHDLKVDGTEGEDVEQTEHRTLDSVIDTQEEQVLTTDLEAEAADSQSQNSGSDNKQMFEKNEKDPSGMIFAETNSSQQVQNNQVPETQLPPEVPVNQNIDVADIINQISEYTRISYGSDVTSIEMQLNPENLGKVYLQISSTKEGSITAQLAAQNEAVKEALETQMIELRQSLHQQGIKVDAIEVTVSTHEFEKNLEQNAEGEKQQAQQQEEAQHGRRSLNLNSLDGLSGLMTEEEMLAAKIMKENGNTMDVTA